ncbi:hypothetical protein RCL_jg19424.t1 [Rhizophagus clarus]|uniref:Uncharacterized protein n=2 Tax=Rhizophagus clarus TaxID=94130 RepID=A0A8H3LQW0_9GLOM|nr:hypothetical protein RCL_jg19424.t1 [Rhizophagus clarus]
MAWLHEVSLAFGWIIKVFLEYQNEVFSNQIITFFHLQYCLSLFNNNIPNLSYTHFGQWINYYYQVWFGTHEKVLGMNQLRSDILRKKKKSEIEKSEKLYKQNHIAVPIQYYKSTDISLKLLWKKIMVVIWLMIDIMISDDNEAFTQTQGDENDNIDSTEQ